MAASILKGVSGVATCAGPVTSAGYNLSDEATDSCSLTGPGDLCLPAASSASAPWPPTAVPP